MPKRNTLKSKLSIIVFLMKLNSKDKCLEFLFKLRFP